MNTTVVYGLVTISALLATAMRLTRKYIMKYMKNYLFRKLKGLLLCLYLNN